jgi:hypothetical protein
MASTKYGHYIKKLKYEKNAGKNKGSGNADFLTWPKGKDMEGINLNFAWGYFSKTGMWGGEKSAHSHPYGEVLVFTGLDYNKPSELGAEIEIKMGAEGENHVFNTPTIITAPAGFAHTPLSTKKAAKPFGFLAINLDKEYKPDDIPKNDRVMPSAGKYDNLVKKMEFRDLTQRPMGGNADYMAAWNGKNMEGFKLNFTFAFHGDTGPWHGGKDPHVHINDEALLFVGMDPARPDYLGAEIQIAMGKEQEIHVFDYPAVVIAPAGFVHCPLITRKVETPYIFSAICLNTEHQTTWLGTGKFPWEQ